MEKPKCLFDYMQSKDRIGSLNIVKGILKNDGRDANNSQLAIALSVDGLVMRRATSQGKKKNRVMIQMPPGTGKSVVISLLLGLLHSDYKKITLLYNNPDLLRFEQNTIDSL